MTAADSIAGIARYAKLERLYAYWHGKRPSPDLLPGRRHLDVLELREWIGNLTLLEALSGGADFYYRLYGTTVAGYFGGDYTGRRVSDLPAEVQAVVLPEYRQAMASRQPTLIEPRRMVIKDHFVIVKFLLPLATDGRAVNMLLSAVYPAG